MELPIFLVVGAPAAGKSTVSQALALRFERALHINVDDLRTMVVAGVAHPGAVWSDELVQQLTLARETACRMALAYHSAGFAVVIDDFWDANDRADYRALEGRGDFYKVVLYPSEAEALRRSHNRSSDPETRAFIDAGIRTVYAQMAGDAALMAEDGWLVVDSTELSAEHTADAILEKTGARG